TATFQPQRDAAVRRHRHFDRHDHTGNGPAHDHALTMKFDEPYPGRRVACRERNRQGARVEPLLTARPGGTPATQHFDASSFPASGLLPVSLEVRLPHGRPETA